MAASASKPLTREGDQPTSTAKVYVLNLAPKDDTFFGPGYCERVGCSHSFGGAGICEMCINWDAVTQQVRGAHG